MATRDGETDSKKFTDMCLALSSKTPANKVKKLKFLLGDLTPEIDIRDRKKFFDLILQLEAEAILNRDEPRRDDALLLCELFDAVSLPVLADEICSHFSVERDPLCRLRISPFRKFLVKLSDHLSQTDDIDKMKGYLEAEGYANISKFLRPDFCSLDVFQAMMQAGLIWPRELSVLREMMTCIGRNDLAAQLIDKFKTTVPYGLRELPRDGIVERPEEVNDLLRLLKAENNRRVGVVGARSGGDAVGIRGMGGIGKTILAQFIAWSESTTRQVIWLDIGQTPDCLALINNLVKALGGNAAFSEISDAQAWVRENTVNKDCLVVLDDVWSAEDASNFDYLSGDCQLLMTTRDADVVRGLRGAVHELQFLPKNQSRALLYKSARLTNDEQVKFTPNMQRIVEELLDQCRGLPLALSLVGSSLLDTRVEQDWQDTLDDLKNTDFVKLRSIFLKGVYPYDSLLAAMNVSFQRLEENVQEKFLDFAIFPEDTDIPSDILELLWASQASRRNSCTAREARRILVVLQRKSMIQKGSEQQGKSSYRIHDLLLDFARGMLGQALIDVQRVFLDALRGRCVNGEWAKFEGNREYYFRYLPYHLHSSQQHEELHQLFFNILWLQQKIKETNLPCLISDFRFLDKEPHDIKLLKSSMMLSADVIEKMTDSLGPQLLGRLLPYANEYSNISKLLTLVHDSCTKASHLVPLSTCLSEPVGPLIKIFRKHSEGVMSLAMSVGPAGPIVISSSSDRSIKIHELETGREINVFEGHTMAVYCLALSHGGTVLASGSFDSTARLWNMDDFQLMFELRGNGGYVNALDFSVDDQRLFTGSNDGNLRVWNVNTGALLDTIRAQDGHIRGLCTTVDGLYTVTGSLDCSIKLWHAETMDIAATLVGHTETVYCVVATHDCRFLVSASGDKTLKIWDLKNYQEVRTLSGHKGEIYSVAVSLDSKHIVSGGDDMIVRLWCFHTGKLLFNFKGHGQSIRFVTILSDGSKALSGSEDQSFRVWDLETSSYLKQDRSPGHLDNVIDVAVTQDGSKSVSACRDGILKIWKCATGEECFTMRGIFNIPF